MRRQILIVFLFLLCAADKIYSQPAQKHFLQHIYIVGNKVTKEEVILREITLRQGDSVYMPSLENALVQSKNQLLNTLLFLTVDLSAQITSSTEFSLTIKVTERWYLVPSFTFQLQDRNFNEWWRHKQLYRTTIGLGLTHYNFRGRNERLGAEIVAGWRQSMLLRYKIPYLNKSKTLGLNTILYHERGHEVGFLTENNRLQFLRVDDRFIFRKTGFETSINFRPKHKINNIFRIALEKYAIDDTLSKKRNSQFLGNSQSKMLLPRFSYQLIFDNRNNVFYPVSGNYFSFLIEQKGISEKPSGVNILTADFTFRQFFSFSPRLSLSTNLKAQLNSKDTLPYIFRSSLGYRHQIRGYEHYVMDGNAAFLLATELRYKVLSHTIKLKHIPYQQFNTIPLAVYPKIFYDEGYVSYPHIKNNNTLLNRWLSGFGFGVDITSYYDKIMRLEYSFNNLGESEVFLHYLEVF